MLYIPDALFQLVKHDECALEQRLTISARLDSLWAAVKKPHTNSMFEVGDNF